uniref:rRNA N-glycosylase n=1 Tax=Setaria italica TaxID=4555 RepID=K3ZL29_SETIT
GHAECTLAIRADTLYLVGFKPKGGSWYAFKNRNHLIQGSTALTFSDDFNSLTGGGTYKDLVKVAVGKNPAQESLNILPNYRHGTTSEQDTKKALVRFVLMFCGAARFQPIRADVTAAWGQAEGGKLRPSFRLYL